MTVYDIWLETFSFQRTLTAEDRVEELGGLWQVTWRSTRRSARTGAPPRTSANTQAGILRNLREDRWQAEADRADPRVRHEDAGPR